MSWEMVRLGNVAEFVRGITFKPTDILELETPDSVGCMRTKNVQFDLDLNDVWKIDKSFVKNPKQFLETGDILISSANSWNLVGKGCWIPKLEYRSTFGGFVSVLRGKHDKIFSRYLYYWYCSDNVQNIVRSFGQKTTNISNLNIERCLNQKIPLPPISEQKRIAAILDKADEIRRKREQAIAKLEQLAQSIFVEMFGDENVILKKWKVQKLGEILDFITSGSRGWARYYADEGDIFIRVQNVGYNKLMLNNVGYVKAPESAEANRTKVEAGDVLLSITADLGRTCVIPSNIGNAYINQHLSILRTKQVLPNFLSAFLASPAGQQQINGRNRQGVKAGLNFDDIKSFEIPLPPIAIQEEYVCHYIKSEKLKADNTKALANHNALFASLQQQAFSGNL